MVSLQWEIVELANHLRNEKLFVASEQQNLRTLNKEVSSASTRLAQLIWILCQQRLNLRRLILSHPDCPPYVCTRRARNLDATRFVDGHKILGIEECSRYGDFLLVLRSSPRLLASCLTAASQPTGGSKSQSSNSSVSSNSSCDGGSTACGVGSVIGATVPLLPPEALTGIYNSLLSGLYGGWDLEDDTDEDAEDSPVDRAAWGAMEDPLPDERNVPFLLRLLRHLAKVQIVMSPDPRRVLSQGSCAFARMYSSMREGLLSLRLFLTAALHKPVGHLIASEWKKDAVDDGLEESDVSVWDAIGFGWDAEVEDSGGGGGGGGGEEMAGASAEEWKNRGFEETPCDASFSAKSKKRKGCSRKAAVRLAALVRRFLRSLRANARHFPAPLRWLIAHVRQEMLLAAATSVNSSSSVFMNGSGSIDGVPPIVDQEVGLRRDPVERVAALCTDLAFTSIVCPAVADPAAHGVISPDMPVSVQARRRLMQVAKALQGLALRPFHEEDPRLADLYGLFEKDCVSSIVEYMLEEDEDELEEDLVCGEEDEVEVEGGGGVVGGEEVGGGEGGMGLGLGGGSSNSLRARRGRRRKQRKRRRERLSIPPPIVHSSYTRGLSRSAALFTESELLNLVSFLQTVYTESQSSLVDKKQLAELLDILPATGITVNGKHSSLNSLQPQQPASVSPVTASKRALLGRVTRTRSIRTLSPAGADVLDEGVGGDEDVTPPAGSPMGSNGLSSAYRPASPREDVLVIPFCHSGSECIGMLPEEKVLEMEWERRQGRSGMVGVAGVRPGGVPLIGGDRELSGKRTRFSLSHDESSIVSTLEPGEVDGVNVADETRSVEVDEEEAVSNHSVASSLDTEEEEEEDNLSDMVSANVSSRGTPNISGRDTPSSQITEGDGEEGRVGGSGGAEEEDGSGVGGVVGRRGPEGADVVGGDDSMGPGLEGISGEGGMGMGGVLGSRGGPHPPNCRHRHPVSKQQHQQQQQQTRSDIDDKFGKFEIKKLIEGDETVSLVSDTWSTDVLASDSETVDLNRDSTGSGSVLGQGNALHQLNHLSPGQPLVGGPSFSRLSSLVSPPNEDGLLGAGALGSGVGARQDPSGQLLDVSETGSEAWSVDVLASDYERMCEVDTDDAGSVARSDDTARSELETEGVGLRGEMERAVSMGEEMGAAAIVAAAAAARGSEEKATPPLHGTMGARGPSPGLSSRGLSPGPASTFRPIREEEEALLAGELELSMPCQRPTPRYITPGIPSQGNLINLHVIEGVEEGKPDGPLKADGESLPLSLKPPVEFSSQGIDPLPMLPQQETPHVPPNQSGFMHQLCGQFSGASISTPLKPPPHDHHTHHRRRNRHAHTKSAVTSGTVNLLGGQGNLIARPNGRVRGEDDVDDEDDDDEDADLEEELEADFLSGPGCGARLSSTSLASSSSSSGGGGGGEGARRRIIPALPPSAGLPHLPPVETLNANGALLPGDSAVAAASSFSQQQQPSTSQGRNPLMGAIPKSISFDKTAERGDKDLLEDEQKQKGGFFRLKTLFKSRAKKPGRGSGRTASVDDLAIHGYGSPHLSFDGSQGSNGRVGEAGESPGHGRLRLQASMDTAIPSQSDAMEDILAKYRRKPEASTTTPAMGESPVSLSSLGVTPAMNGPRHELPPGCRAQSSPNGEMSLMRRKPVDGGGVEEGMESDEDSEGENEDDPEEDTGYGTGVPEDEEVALEDAKRKLRLVLSTANVLHHPLEGRATGRGMREAASSLSSSASSWANTNGGLPGMCVPHRAARNRLTGTSNELVSFLRLQLAEAVSLHDDVHQPNTIHIRETLRCVMAFDNQRCFKLFRGLRDDYRRRAPYLAYLVRCKQGLLSTLAHLERLLERTGREKEACSKALIWVCVRLFVKRHEKDMVNFIADFGQPNAAVDEKAVLVRTFLQRWNSLMEEDPTWQGASEEQVELARISLERVVMGRVYLYALYPNGDGDISRDQVLHEHMKKLSKVIKPSHKDLRIPKVFCRECPWPSAQAEISALGSYCTPRDKVDCVTRTCSTLITLLAMATERTGAPAADDLIPVLVYVLIKANPPSLLSTVQFVNSFYGSNLTGADQYWWVQFCSAIEFIKTMDYSD
ncbi:receptor-mediated endocytosis protein 6 homolog [Ischnura elegans]|uniref:receptor-mediated endocytosis protein 6 homolog n=1 Tax=Ischnura elegans TaxID=197161 RepID=UPI001ED86AAB|nr:receptor-mediated endocytosis protein 6 homolog [Ischnura elegans]